MFLTRPSPRLAIFIACYVARAGEGLGTRLIIISIITKSLYMYTYIEKTELGTSISET